MARISIIGSGYVGLVSAAAFADLGNDVTGIDIDENKVASLRRGECPIYEPGLPELLTRNLKAGRLRFTTSYADAVPDSEFVFICDVCGERVLVRKGSVARSPGDALLHAEDPATDGALRRVVVLVAFTIVDEVFGDPGI